MEWILMKIRFPELVLRLQRDRAFLASTYFHGSLTPSSFVARDARPQMVLSKSVIEVRWIKAKLSFSVLYLLHRMNIMIFCKWLFTTRASWVHTKVSAWNCVWLQCTVVLRTYDRWTSISTWEGLYLIWMLQIL